MYERILIAYDGSEPADGAFSLATQIAVGADAQLTLAHAVETHSRGAERGGGEREPDGADDEVAAWERRLEEIARPVAGDLKVDRYVRTGKPVTVLLDLIDQIGADLVVAGTHGVGHIKQALLGSVSHRLLREAPCDALFVPSPLGPDRTYSILVGLDGSPASIEAMAIGAGLASAMRAPLVLAHVAPSPPFTDSVYIGDDTRAKLKADLRRHGHDLLDRAHEQLGSTDCQILEERREGHVSEELLRHASPTPRPSCSSALAGPAVSRH